MYADITLNCQSVCVLIPNLELFGSYANESMHIHEHMSDVTAGSDEMSRLVCA